MDLSRRAFIEAIMASVVDPAQEIAVAASLPLPLFPLEVGHMEGFRFYITDTVTGLPRLVHEETWSYSKAPFLFFDGKHA